MPLIARPWREAKDDADAGAKAFTMALIAEAPNASPRMQAIARRFTEVYDESRASQSPRQAFAAAAAAIRPALEQLTVEAPHA